MSAINIVDYQEWLRRRSQSPPAPRPMPQGPRGPRPDPVDRVAVEVEQAPTSPPTKAWLRPAREGSAAPGA